MKEASGEANLTVITIILIGVIVAVATPIINSMMTNTAQRTCCQNAGGVFNGTSKACVGVDGKNITNYWNKNEKTCK